MTDRLSPGHYAGYDVLSKRDTPSWNDKTREVIDARLAVVSTPAFFSAGQWRALEAVCERVMPQPDGARIPLAAYVDRQLAAGKTKGYRFPDMPQPAEAWQRGLAALDEVAVREHRRLFADLTQDAQDRLLQQMADGSLAADSLRGMPPQSFWTTQVLHDVLGAYYAHPESWNEIGWSGPASPRGYVRLQLDRRDAWEPEEARAGSDVQTAKKNERVG